MVVAFCPGHAAQSSLFMRRLKGGREGEGVSYGGPRGNFVKVQLNNL